MCRKLTVLMKGLRNKMIIITMQPQQSKTVVLRLKCDGMRTETRFRLSAKRTSAFKSVGASVQSTTESRGVRISSSNAGYTKLWGSVKGTGYPLHLPVSPSLPLPCITVCHQISTGLYSINSIILINWFISSNHIKKNWRKTATVKDHHEVVEIINKSEVHMREQIGIYTHRWILEHHNYKHRFNYLRTRRWYDQFFNAKFMVPKCTR